jgi:hypothetical protein
VYNSSFINSNLLRGCYSENFFVLNDDTIPTIVKNQDRSLTEQTYQTTRELMDKFIERQGTFICRRLLGDCELTTLEGQKEFKEKDLLNKVCK